MKTDFALLNMIWRKLINEIITLRYAIDFRGSLLIILAQIKSDNGINNKLNVFEFVILLFKINVE
jgi:hypothetical protein